jgi:MFS transporter, SP family, inositol transporter
MTLDHHPSARRPHPWWVGFVCGLATFVDAAATTGIGIALVLFQAASPGAEGLTGNQVGFLTAALTLGVAVGSLAGGRLGDHFGRRKVFLVTMALIVLGSVAPFLSISFPLMLLGITVIGLGVGADLPVALATISESADDSNRGKIIVFSNILGGFGIAMSVLLSIAFGHLGATGGHIIFGAFGAVGLVTLMLRLSIPESTVWLAARDERRSGVQTVRADKSSLRDLVRQPYNRPFFVLACYYTLAAVAVSIAGSFGTYVAVNLAGVDVARYNTATLVALPLAVIAQMGFMAVADTRWRMPAYVVGAAFVVLSNLIPVAFGFTFATVLTSVLMSTVAGAFCFETIMKVWTQESFPTLLRGTAQGFIYGVSRFAAAGLNAVTPMLLALNPKGLYLAVAVLAAVGFGIGWWGFRRNARNEFDTEHQLEHPAPATV